MNRTVSTLGGVALLAALLAGGAYGRADDEFKPEEGFTSLFNGKDLSGWHYKGSREQLQGKTETADQRVAVEDGAIVFRAKDKAGKGGIRELATVRTFPKDFHLRLEFRASPRADSGVYVCGPQLQVRDFIRRNEHRHLSKFVNDGWNTLDVVVRKDVTTATVNNKALTDKDDFSLTFKGGKAAATLNGKPVDPRSVQVRKGRTADCRCNGQWFETMTNLPANGGIGLQAETGKFEFRRIRIRELE